MRECLTYDDVQIAPKYSDMESRGECSLETRWVNDHVLSVPVISSPMSTISEKEMAWALFELGAIGTIHRFTYSEVQVNHAQAIVDDYQEKGIRCVSITPFAIGATSDYLFRTKKLYETGVRVFIVDIAHGHSKHMKDVMKALRQEFSGITVIGGSIATKDAATDQLEWGVDILRVGMGNGSLCETRIRTGIGIPQLTAIMDVYEATQGKNIIIADGGIRTPGDAAKAIGAGADLVMLGSLLAGTKETPGKFIRIGNFPDEQLYKQYKGSASESAKMDRNENTDNIEGNSKIISYKGKVERIIKAITDGLKSSMSYVGARTLDEFRAKVDFVRVTSAGQIEAQPHLLLK